jgi:hypothetical protein
MAVRKPLIAAGCCGLIFLAGWAFGQQQALDASGWHQVGKADDLALIVKAYIQGYSDGDSAMEKVAAVLTKGNPIDPETKKLVAPQAVHIAEVQGMGQNRDLTVAKVKDAMSAFYADYRNAPVCWNTALQFSAWSLNADAPTQQELDLARKQGADMGCK